MPSRDGQEFCQSTRYTPLDCPKTLSLVVLFPVSEKPSSWKAGQGKVRIMVKDCGAPVNTDTPRLAMSFENISPEKPRHVLVGPS